MHPDQKTIPIQPDRLKGLLDFTPCRSVSVEESFIIQARFLNRFTRWIQSSESLNISGLNDFPYMYIVNGVSNAIETLSYENRDIIVHKDEYPVYHYLPKKISVDEFTDHRDSLVVLSQPFSMDGNMNYELYDSACRSNGKIFLDCAYVGSITGGDIELRDNVESVCFSFSKGFGLQYNRIGVLYTKVPNPILEKYKEYAYVNCFSARLCMSIMNNFSVTDIPDQYRSRQIEICATLGIEPSDCVWLGINADKNKVSLYRHYSM